MAPNPLPRRPRLALQTRLAPLQLNLPLALPSRGRSQNPRIRTSPMPNRRRNSTAPSSGHHRLHHLQRHQIRLLRKARTQPQAAEQHWKTAGAADGEEIESGVGGARTASWFDGSIWGVHGGYPCGVIHLCEQGGGCFECAE